MMRWTVRHIASFAMLSASVVILVSNIHPSGRVVAWIVPSTIVPIATSPKSALITKSSCITTRRYQSTADSDSSSGSSSSEATLSVKTQLESSIAQLKRILEREYITFFNPMECDYYSNDVTFVDPLTSLTGINSYQSNVDMLSGRTLVGSFLFRDARIILHTITGGTINDNLEIGNITTRWTLKFTFQILPWQPSPSFTGISVYTIKRGGKKGIQVVQQNDYWDSINLQPGGSYQPVSNSIAIQHFVSLLRPSGNFQAKSAGPELPYTTLRLKGSDYEIRRYPSYTAIQMVYDRRDEAFVNMGSYTTGMNPLAPAIICVNSTDLTNVVKTMTWPIRYALPGETASLMKELPTLPLDAPADIVSIITVPERVVAIRTFNDMIIEPLVRKVDQMLRQSLQRDGLLHTNEEDEGLLTTDNIAATPAATNEILIFAQYDATYSMGERRCEVHIPLPDGTHPW